jgi:hypothetical protein
MIAGETGGNGRWIPRIEVIELRKIPIALRLRGAQPRTRVSVTGEVIEVRTVRRESGVIFEADLNDGTGVVTLVFLGRRDMGGILPGAGLVAEGTLIARHHLLELLNPNYRFALSSSGG